MIMMFDLNKEIFHELSLPKILVHEPPTNLNVAQILVHVFSEVVTPFG